MCCRLSGGPELRLLEPKIAAESSSIVLDAPIELGAGCGPPLGGTVGSDRDGG